jgi:hypothetical protein
MPRATNRYTPVPIARTNDPAGGIDRLIEDRRLSFILSPKGVTRFRIYRVGDV